MGCFKEVQEMKMVDSIICTRVNKQVMKNKRNFPDPYYYRVTLDPTFSSYIKVCQISRFPSTV